MPETPFVPDASTDERPPVAYLPPGPEPSRPPETRHRFSGAALFFSAVTGGIIGAVLLAAMLVGIFGWPSQDRGSSTVSTPASGDVTINVAETDETFAEAVATKVTPSVVNIAIGQGGVDRFTGQSVMQTVGNGSGVIIRSDGYILTNNHVVEAADEIIVTVGVEDVKATVVGTDPSSDLAVIKIDQTGLPAVEIGKSSELSVGEPVVAIGSPFGLERTVTSGIVSALGRSSLAEGTEGLSVYTSLIQTDAAINPGNSGGALCNGAGQLVGINTLIQSTTGSSAGIGFAIPVDFAIEIADELIASGRVAHPFMGVGTVTVDASVARRFGLSVDSGALVQSITAGSPAQEAGLMRGDIIIRIDDTEVLSVEDVFIAVRTHRVGDVVPVELMRDGERLTLDITLGSDAGAR